MKSFTAFMILFMCIITIIPIIVLILEHSLHGDTSTLQGLLNTLYYD